MLKCPVVAIRPVRTDRNRFPTWICTAMEYSIHLDAPAPDLGAIIDALQDVDPAAFADLDRDGQTLRLSTNMLDSELLEALDASGHPITPRHIVRLPSVCCGSCSG